MPSTPEMPPLTRQEAERSVQNLMNGEPPGSLLVGYLSVGLERDLDVFARHYFAPDSFIVSKETEGSTFKIVQAYYGGGKSHYLRAVESVAHHRGFASAFVGLKKDECPLTRFDLIYHSVAVNLTARTSSGLITGFGNLLRQWVDAIVESSEDDEITAVRAKVAAIRDLPLMSIKVAIRVAAIAHASGDAETFDEALTYLTAGTVSAALRKHGVLDKVDKTNGSLALKSVVGWLKDIGYTGFALILDEGDRSLSIVSAKDRMGASNNLVQLINETAANEDAWSSTVLLYSIPSWEAFENTFGHNEALIGRVRTTGFPQVPPAVRIVLDDRYPGDKQRKQFCCELAPRLSALFRVAYPEQTADEGCVQTVAALVAQSVVAADITSGFRRLFVQSFLTVLFRLSEGVLSSSEVDDIVRGQAQGVSISG